MRRHLWAGLLWGITGGLLAADNKPLYENNFEQSALDKVPEDFLVLQGDFTVKEQGGNKFLELPGAPLDTFEALFGPTEKVDVSVSARIHGSAKGRRFPAFGVGLGGVSGFKLVVAPAKKLLELRKGEDVITSVPYAWESGCWTRFRLQVRKAESGGWAVEGKAWKDGEAEPAKWLVSHAENSEPITGRASIGGSPFAGTPIRFDDLKVVAIPEKP